MFAVVVVAGCFFPKDLPGFMIPVIAILCIGMVVVAQVLFAGRVRMRTHAEIVAERLQMEQAGLLVSESFRAIRAFEVDEFEDGGGHLFVELENRSVLFLNGQYLEEYLPVTGRYPRPRQFPCTEFTIRRHKESGHVVDVLCSGTVFEPELVAPPFLDKGLEKYSSLDEASIMKGKTYDELKAEHTLR